MQTWLKLIFLCQEKNENNYSNLAHSMIIPLHIREDYI